jgi:molybdopterin molybdotransferase
MVAQIETTQRIARLTALAEALARVDALVKPVAPQREALGAALGCVLAEDVVVAAPRPGAAIALRDGFAVSAEMTADAGAYAPAMLAAKPVRCDAGDSLPAGTDAVAPLDAIAVHDPHAEALAPVAPGEGVLMAGADAPAGAVLRRAGERLRAIDLAVFAAAGITQVMIRRPRVQLVHGKAGDDIIAACIDLIARTITAGGGVVTVSGGKAGDLEAAFADPNADAVISIGGTGSGRNDASVRALARMGRVECHGIGLTPGETAAFGLIESRPVLLIPGRIDAVLAAFLVIGEHILARLAGSMAEKTGSTMILARKVTSTVGLAEVVPVRRHDGKIEPLARGYLPLHALANADGWILVPADSEGYPAGAEVLVRPWP